jgi:hypothetical protein
MSSLINMVHRKEIREWWRYQVKADAQNMVGESAVSSNTTAIFIGRYRKVQKIWSWRKHLWIIQMCILLVHLKWRKTLKSYDCAILATYG